MMMDVLVASVVPAGVDQQRRDEAADDADVVEVGAKRHRP